MLCSVNSSKRQHAHTPIKTETKVCIGLAIAAIAIGGIVASYLAWPAMHLWVNSHVFTPLMNMSAKQQLLAIGLPILGMGILSLCVTAFKYRRRAHTTEPSPQFDLKWTKISDYPINDKPYVHPKLKRAIAGLAVMTLFILGALIAAHYVPAVQLNLKQSLLYIALPASGTSFAINLGVLLPKAKLKPIEPGRDWEGSPIYSGI